MLPYSKVAMYNINQAKEHQMVPNCLPIYNQPHFSDNNRYQPPFHHLSSFGSRNVFQRHPYETMEKNYLPRLSGGLTNNGYYSPQYSPGTRLFHLLKDYANNAYSLHLMDIDSELAESSPKRRKEYFHIMNSLSYAQTSLKPTENIKLQLKNVETAALKLSSESIKLSIEVYKAKSDEILDNINALVQSKIKYIPFSSKVINYVKPNLSKRRFSSQIIPKVVSDVENLISKLSKHPSMLQNTEQKLEVPKRNLIPMCDDKACDKNLTIVLTNTGVRNVHSNRDLLPEKASSIQNMEVNVLESRKRKIKIPTLPPINDNIVLTKRGSKLHKSSSTSSIPKILQSHTSTPNVDGFDVDIDSSPKPDSSRLASPKPETSYKFKHLHNKVKTAEEAYTTYKTYAPFSQVLPSFSDPPDMCRLGILSEHTSESMVVNIQEICHDAHNNSFPDYSLLTLHSRGHENFPKTHISVKMNPMAMKNPTLNIIPKNLNFVYEVLLLDHTFLDYKEYLPAFISWIIEKNSKVMFTVPELYFTELDSLLPHLSLCEISRPFQAALCSSLIT